MPETLKSILGVYKINQQVIHHYLDGGQQTRSKRAGAENAPSDDEPLFDMADMNSDDEESQKDASRPSCRILAETMLLIYLSTTGTIRSQTLVVDTSYDELVNITR